MSRLYQGLAKLLQRCRRPKLGSLALPHEIILIIASHLHDPSLLSLALTCRTIYQICFPRDLCLRPEKKQELLLLLEKDLAKQYYCYKCAKLHRWLIRRNRLVSFDIDLPCEYLWNCDYVFSFVCSLRYPHARLVMNRHLHGRNHGLPLSKLHHRVWIRREIFGVLRSEHQQARIIDGKLLTRSVLTLSHWRGDAKELRTYIDCGHNYCCRHLALGFVYPNSYQAQIPELLWNKDTCCYFASNHQSFGSCAICTTDYDVDIDWRGKWRGFKIKVTTYRQFGDCRSPDSWSWRAMTEEFPYKTEPRASHLEEYRLGAIRDRWYSAKGVVTKTGGVWIAAPRRDFFYRDVPRTVYW